MVNIAVSCFFVLIFCLVAWPMIRGNAATANYDFITTCCIIILFVETALSSKNDFLQEWMTWPVYLFTVRIINYPILLLTLLSLVHVYRFQKIRCFSVNFLLVLLLIVPFIARNVILSGYPFFPVYQPDFFSFDWKADKKLTSDIVKSLYQIFQPG